MIELKGSRFTQILPQNLSSQTRTRALAYAIGRQVDKLLVLADRMVIWAGLDRVPEELLDYLAAELRTPAYRADYAVEVKRTLVRQSLLFYATMGTPGAVDRLIQSIFGSGQIQEWFEYGGEPHHFRATVGASGLTITPEGLEELRRVLASVKRLSSWLDSIATVTPMESRPLRVAAAPCGSYARTTLPPVFVLVPAVIRLAVGAGGSITRTAIPQIKEGHNA